MEDINYIIVLDHATASLIKIKLAESEKKKMHLYEDFEDFLTCGLLKEHGIRIEDCSWMSCKDLNEIEYNF